MARNDSQASATASPLTTTGRTLVNCDGGSATRRGGDLIVERPPTSMIDRFLPWRRRIWQLETEIAYLEALLASRRLQVEPVDSVTFRPSAETIVGKGEDDVARWRLEKLVDREPERWLTVAWFAAACDAARAKARLQRMSGVKHRVVGACVL